MRTFRRTEQFHKYGPSCFKRVHSDIHSLERKGTRKSLSLRSLATLNINFAKVSLNGKKPFVGGHLFARDEHRQHVLQASRRRFTSGENLPIPLDHLNVSSSCLDKLLKSPEENTPSPLDEVESQSILDT